jgi:hypothetical protein
MRVAEEHNSAPGWDAVQVKIDELIASSPNRLSKPQ